MLSNKNPKNDRIELLQNFDAAPDSALFAEVTIAAVLDCSLASLRRLRCYGGGIPYKKLGQSVRYQKCDVLNWLEKQLTCKSTSDVVGEGLLCS